MYLLDTNILSAMRFDPDVLRHDDICTSAINLWEIERRARRRPGASDLQSFVTFVRDNIPIVSFDEEAAHCYALWSRSLDPDAMIAAIAIVQNMTLVTRNAADFEGIRGLRLARW